MPPNYTERFSTFLDDARAIRPRYDSSTFFAHEYKLNVDRNRAAAELISAVKAVLAKLDLTSLEHWEQGKSLTGYLTHRGFLQISPARSTTRQAVSS